MSDISKQVRNRRVQWTIVGILALAGVIFIGGALSWEPEPSVPASDTQPSSTQQAEQLADRASAALAANDTTAAAALATQALQLDSGNATAKRVLASATKPTPSPAATTSTPAAAVPTTPSAPRDDTAYAKKGVAQKKLLPTEIAGWSAGAAIAEGGEGLVTFEPNADDPNYGLVTRVVYSAHDRGSEKKAKQFVSGVVKKTYPSDDTAVSVGVVPNAYFGTNGSGSAVVAFSRGRYAFEVTVFSQGLAASELKTTGTKLAASSPAAR